jgi:hypothetical protein
MAVNPQNPNQIAVVTFSEGWGPTAGAPVWKSDDGGTSWRKVFQIPQPNAVSGGPGDQNIGYDGNGKLFVAELAGGLSPPRCFIFRQTAGPDDPLTPGTTYGDDQPHLGVDQHSSGACPGLVYSPWLDFSQPHERSTVTKTADGGVSLSNVGAGDNTSFPNRTAGSHWLSTARPMSSTRPARVQPRATSRKPTSA